MQGKIIDLKDNRFGVERAWDCETDGRIHHHVYVVIGGDGCGIEPGEYVNYSCGLWVGRNFRVLTEDYPSKEFSWTEQKRRKYGENISGKNIKMGSGKDETM
jgi:hypothetical protein